MGLTANEYRQKLILALGGEGSLTPRQAELAWREHDDQPSLRLQFLYALIEAINFKLGVHWQDFDTRTVGGNSLQASQRFDHLLALAQRATEQIALIELGPVAGSLVYGAEVDEMVTTLPLPTPAGFLPDPNSPKYSADPIWWVREG